MNGLIFILLIGISTHGAKIDPFLDKPQRLHPSFFFDNNDRQVAKRNGIKLDSTPSIRNGLMDLTNPSSSKGAWTALSLDRNHEARIGNNAMIENTGTAPHIDSQTGQTALFQDPSLLRNRGQFSTIMQGFADVPYRANGIDLAASFGQGNSNAFIAPNTFEWLVIAGSDLTSRNQLLNRQQTSQKYDPNSQMIYVAQLPDYYLDKRAFNDRHMLADSPSNYRPDTGLIHVFFGGNTVVLYDPITPTKEISLWQDRISTVQPRDPFVDWNLANGFSENHMPEFSRQRGNGERLLNAIRPRGFGNYVQGSHHGIVPRDPGFPWVVDSVSKFGNDRPLINEMNARNWINRVNEMSSPSQRLPEGEANNIPSRIDKRKGPNEYEGRSLRSNKTNDYRNQQYSRIRPKSQPHMYKERRNDRKYYGKAMGG